MSDPQNEKRNIVRKRRRQKTAWAESITTAPAPTCEQCRSVLQSGRCPQGHYAKDRAPP